jgi:hypothetical protein
MRAVPGVVLGLAAAALMAQGDKAKASKYLTKDGKLAHELEVSEREGGGVAAKARRWTVKPGGSWVAAVHDVGVTTTMGELSQNDRRPPAGARSYQVVYGTAAKVVRNVSATGPLGKPSAKTAKGRYAGLVAALEKLLKEDRSAKEK